jgi:hypothetical protein
MLAGSGAISIRTARAAPRGPSIAIARALELSTARSIAVIGAPELAGSGSISIRGARRVPGGPPAALTGTFEGPRIAIDVVRRRSEGRQSAIERDLSSSRASATETDLVAPTSKVPAGP